MPTQAPKKDFPFQIKHELEPGTAPFFQYILNFSNKLSWYQNLSWKCIPFTLEPHHQQLCRWWIVQDLHLEADMDLLLASYSMATWMFQWLRKCWNVQGLTTCHSEFSSLVLIFTPQISSPTSRSPIWLFGAAGIVSADIKWLNLRMFADKSTEQYGNLLSQGITDSVVYLVFSFLIFFSNTQPVEQYRIFHSFPPAHSTLQSIQ